MKNSHINTAIKALEKQVVKFREQMDSCSEKAKEAAKQSDFFAQQVEKIQKQISSLKSEVLEEEKSTV
jgi:uncharacterized coiled-coil DUF342 family protein